MQIFLSPVRRDDLLSLERTGDKLILNGEAFDFGPLPEGATLPVEAIDSHWFVGPVTRKAGKLQVVLALPHGANAPEGTLFPAPIIDPDNGQIALPAHSVEDLENAEH